MLFVGVTGARNEKNRRRNVQCFLEYRRAFVYYFRTPWTLPLEDLRESEKKGVLWSRHINENLDFLFVDTEGENLRTICDRHSTALPT